MQVKLLRNRRCRLARKLKAPLIMVALAIVAILAGIFHTELRQLFGLKEPVSVQQTGNASTRGDKSPANTGNGNSVQYNDAQSSQDSKSAPEKKQ